MDKEVGATGLPPLDIDQPLRSELVAKQARVEGAGELTEPSVENRKKDLRLSRQVEWELLIECLNELYATRRRSLTRFDLEVARSVYEACSKALTGSATDAQVWRAVSAPTGSGKTTAALAYAAAMVRSGGSVLFLANTKRECNEAYRTLEIFLPGKVAIRTTDHDYTPAAFFTRSKPTRHLSAHTMATRNIPATY